mgnify:FL=1
MAAELQHDIQYIVNQVFHEIAAKYHNIYRMPPWRILGINTSSWLIFYMMKVSSYFQTPKCIEYIFQYFIRCDSTANKFGKKKEAFTYKLIRQILEKTHGMFILHWVEVNILLEIFQQRKKSSPSCFRDEVYK